jgi:Nif-specific regulatory protein
MKPSQTLSIPESELLVVQEAAKLITRYENPEDSVRGILRLLSQLLGLNRGRVLLPDVETGTLGIHYSYGLSEEEVERGRYLVGEGVTGKVYQTNQIALIQNIDEEPTYLARAVDRTTLPSEVVAYIALPIVADKTPIGVLAVHRLRMRERAFERDLTLLQIMATFIGQVLRIRELVSERTAHLVSENLLLKNKLESQGARYGIMGHSPALQQAIQQALQVADTNTTVLLLGESGTGKERFARMQHLASSRSDGPFISINCAAIPASLIESELFGHEKGAFTGATGMKKGKIELASGGTLFLDEIGDMDMDLQAKLLKVLEYRVIQRVGGTSDIPVDVRILAATHKNLQEAVNQNSFRLDLYYRLNVFPIRLPPLRARRGDVPILSSYFLNIANEEFGRNLSFTQEAINLLESYPWPGNIRQLENLVKRTVLLCIDKQITKSLIEQVLDDEDGVQSPEWTNADINPAVQVPTSSTKGWQHDDYVPSVQGLRPYQRVTENERTRLTEALHYHQGNKTRAAISLGMTPRQLRYRIQKLGIEVQ